ncbi:hypothetical protein TNCV_1666461 [Trichonephila clavipes]|nr:hypothetical protein TNCV_1666461 [Trichonephila clavipes]
MSRELRMWLRIDGGLGSSKYGILLYIKPFTGLLMSTRTPKLILLFPGTPKQTPGPLGVRSQLAPDILPAERRFIIYVQHLNVLYSDFEIGCQVIYSQFGLAIHQNDHQARRRFVEWAQNEIAVVPDFHKRILFIDEAHFWLNGYVNKQNCRIWSEANPQVYVETPLHPEKLTVWCALWAGGILLQKR